MAEMSNLDIVREFFTIDSQTVCDLPYEDFVKYMERFHNAFDNLTFAEETILCEELERRRSATH